MFTLTFNGKEVQSEKDLRLLEVLRNELKLTSVKNGCGEGGCGTCTVIIDNKAMRACTQKLSKLEGKSVITVEGMTDREKEVYGYSS